MTMLLLLMATTLLIVLRAKAPEASAVGVETPAAPVRADVHIDGFGLRDFQPVCPTPASVPVEAKPEPPVAAAPLTYTPEELEIPDPKLLRMGSGGRLYLPDLAISVSIALVEPNGDYGRQTPEDYAQWAADQPDTCIWMPTAGAAICADHNFEGFSAISRLKGGEQLYRYLPSGEVEVYICESLDMKGLNDGYIRDSAGVSADESEGLWLYTCHVPSHGGQDILIAKFVRQ